MNNTVYVMHEVILILMALTLIALVYLFSYLVEIDQPARAFTIFGIFVFFSRSALLFWAVNEDSGVLSKLENAGITDFLRSDMAFILSFLPLLLSIYVQLLEYSKPGRWIKLHWLKWQRAKKTAKHNGI